MARYKYILTGYRSQGIGKPCREEKLGVLTSLKQVIPTVAHFFGRYPNQYDHEILSNWRKARAGVKAFFTERDKYISMQKEIIK